MDRIESESLGLLYRHFADELVGGETSECLQMSPFVVSVDEDADGLSGSASLMGEVLRAPSGYESLTLVKAPTDTDETAYIIGQCKKPA